MSTSKNIEEYVVNSIISHLKKEKSNLEKRLEILETSWKEEHCNYCKNLIYKYSKYKCVLCDFWYDRNCGGGSQTNGANQTICPFCCDKKDEAERRVI